MVKTNINSSSEPRIYEIHEENISSSQITLEEFKHAYLKKLNSELVSNFWSRDTMKYQLANYKNLEQVKEYVEKNSHSRSAEVWNQLLKEKKTQNTEIKDNVNPSTSIFNTKK